MGSFGQFMNKMRSVGLTSAQEISDKMKQRLFEDKALTSSHLMETLIAFQKFEQGFDRS